MEYTYFPKVLFAILSLSAFTADTVIAKPINSANMAVLRQIISSCVLLTIHYIISSFL
jgi:hypothetical protein